MILPPPPQTIFTGETDSREKSSVMNCLHKRMLKGSGRLMKIVIGRARERGAKYGEGIGIKSERIQTAE